MPRHGPAGRPAAERVWSEGLAAVKRPPPSALSRRALCFGTRRQQTQGTGPWARGAELHCTEPELRFAADPALGLPSQAPEHPGSVAKSFGPRPQLQDMQANIKARKRNVLGRSHHHRQLPNHKAFRCRLIALNPALPSTAPQPSSPISISSSSSRSSLPSCCDELRSRAPMMLCGHATPTCAKALLQ